MYYQDQQLISYLESEDVPVVNLSVFKKDRKKPIVKDIKPLQDRAEKIQTIHHIIKKSDEKDVDSEEKSKPIADSNVDRRVRPLSIDFLLKKDDVVWL